MKPLIRFAALAVAAVQLWAESSRTVCPGTGGVARERTRRATWRA